MLLCLRSHQLIMLFVCFSWDLPELCRLDLIVLDFYDIMLCPLSFDNACKNRVF